MKRSQVVDFQERLFDEQRRLLEEIERSHQAQVEKLSTADEISDVPTHGADQDAEGVGAERTIEDRLRKELEQVQRALRRIVDNQYGICESCGTEIARDRLDLIPQATLCVSCAAEH